MMNSGKYKIENNQIVNIESGVPIPDDEPVVVFRGKDRHIVDVLEEYAMMCSIPSQIEAIEVCAADIRTWQEDNRELIKEPD